VHEHAINVSLSLDSGVLAIHIDDDGIAYNPLDAPLPRFDLPIEERRIGGLGVHIMKTLARSVEYRRADGRNNLDIQIGIGNGNETAASAGVTRSPLRCGSTFLRTNSFTGPEYSSSR